MMTKTDQEIERLAVGGRLLDGILEQVIDRAQIGATGRMLSELAERLIRGVGGTPAFKGYGDPPFPSALCVSVNSCVVHGVPSDDPFHSGDIIGLDIGMVYQGLYCDMARTVAVGSVSARERQLITATYESLDRALAMVRPGITTGDIGHAVQGFIEKHGFGVVRALAGHGVGHELHEEPEVPNFGQAGSGEKLVSGMVLAIEPMVTLGKWEISIADDHWSVMTRDGSKAAHAEDMVAVTGSGHRVLTRSAPIIIKQYLR